VIERTCTNLITEWYIEGHAVNGIFMSFERMDEVACCCIPQFTGSIVTAGQKLIAIFIKTAIC